MSLKNTGRFSVMSGPAGEEYINMKAKRVLKANVTEGNADRLTEICRTAAQLFYEKGFDATSVSDIADAMKLTKAALYYYIEGKQELCRLQNGSRKITASTPTTLSPNQLTK